MKTIKITDLNAKKSIECQVDVLGNLHFSDPIVAGVNLAPLRGVMAVSPNGKWLALARGREFSEETIPTIASARVGAKEIIVPLESGWRNVVIRDIDNEGVVLFEAAIGAYMDSGRSSRPILFKAGNKKTRILPPPYDREAWLNYQKVDEDNRSSSHHPLCYMGAKNIFGWSLRPYSKRQKTCQGHDYFVCHSRKGRGWKISYLPRSLDGKSLRPTLTGAFLWTEAKGGIIRFGVVKGGAPHAFKIALNGEQPVIWQVAAQETFIGGYTAAGSSSTFLVRPADNAVVAFSEKQMILRGISTNGHYVVGCFPRTGWFLLQAQGQEYVRYVLQVPGWRIKDVARVMDDGSMYATATCVTRDHDCFRLRVPVRLVPQW